METQAMGPPSFCEVSHQEPNQVAMVNALLTLGNTRKEREPGSHTREHWAGFNKAYPMAKLVNYRTTPWDAAGLG